jgi:hypothetical protein
MDYRIITVQVEHDEPIVFPAACLETAGYCIIELAKSASDQDPRVYHLFRTADNGLALLEVK